MSSIEPSLPEAALAKSEPDFADLKRRFQDRNATIGVAGLGYVGLPLLMVFGDCGFACIGFDIDEAKVEMLNAGESYIGHLSSGQIQELNATGRFKATTDYHALADADAILICVPTPLTRQREPDVSYIVSTGRSIADCLRPGKLVVLESTTYPGTTLEVLRPILESSGLKSDRDFLLAYSPEREDPGNADYSTARIPKVVGGDGELARDLACALYGQIVPRVIPVSTIETAEAVKLTENIFRAVNIAMVNELKVVYGRMGIDVWEVIEAAKSKPFGYMPFYPGPGLGGHCIPIDPYYLAWKAREFDSPTRFIELAGEVNAAMPQYVVDVLVRSLNDRFGKSLKNAKILIMGMAYKKNVDDIRESPALRLVALLEERGAETAYFDPFVPKIPRTREHAELAGRRSVSWLPETFATYDAALICTDHDAVEYGEVVRRCPLVVDTRNATRGVTLGRDKIVAA